MGLKPAPLCCSQHILCSHFPACVDPNCCVSLFFFFLLTWVLNKKPTYFCGFANGGNAEVVQKKLVKACRNFSSSESMRAFPVCSLQLAASSCSSLPSRLPPSPSRSHLSSVSLPPLNLSDAVGPDLALLPLWWFLLSFPVVLTTFPYSAFFFFFRALVSPLSAVYKWQQGNVLTWPFLAAAAAALEPHGSKPLYFVSVILIWSQITITCDIGTI